jgi:uncharacterized membrane protein
MSTTGASPDLRRLATSALVGHVLLIVFSTAALTTFLAGPPGPWLQEEPNATVYRIASRFSGPTYVVLGAIAAWLHATGVFGARRAFGLLVVGSLLPLGAELVGTASGLPFGDYRYTPLLGYRIFERVPFPIPISWFYMLYGCLAICARVLPASDDARTRWRWAFVAGLVLVAWDVSMDPAMVVTSHWIWGDGEMFRAAWMPAWLTAFFTADAFYGMPLANWFGWVLTGTLVARVMLLVVPPSVFASATRRDRLPIVLYAVNGIMPIALCVRSSLWWAAILGTLAMALPVILSLRGAHRAVPATLESERALPV